MVTARMRPSVNMRRLFFVGDCAASALEKEIMRPSREGVSTDWEISKPSKRDLPLFGICWGTGQIERVTFL